jgi:putative transposase
MSYLENLFYPDVLEELGRALAAENYHLLLFTGFTDRDSDPVFDQLMQYRIDGIILASTSLSSELSEEGAQLRAFLLCYSIAPPSVTPSPASRRATGRVASELPISWSPASTRASVTSPGSKTPRPTVTASRAVSSATGVGLCLTHVASDKTPWLEARHIDARWPVVGKPCRIGVDNAAEFHSDAFERGCEQHGITIDWRPIGQPHFGGIIERVIGTMMGLVHELPGTTFSNTVERGNYDSDKTACLTLEELERWLTIAIAKYYHLRGHEGLNGEPPLHRYEQGAAELVATGDVIPTPSNIRAFLIDFLPVCRRSLQRNGITLDHIVYFSNALTPWINDRNRPDPLVIRRDLSRIFVLDPFDNAYLEVPYRMLSRPSITLWEHRLALRRLREKNRAKVDETSLFAAVDEMRAIEREAARLTRHARRNRTRRPVPPPVEALSASHPDRGGDPPRPFDDVEEW